MTLVMLMSLGLVARASARTLYVAPSGNDGNPGSLERPWMSIRRVNGAALKPGDMVRFQGGKTQVWDPPGTSGQPTTYLAPQSGVTYNSYGTGQARISSPSNADVFFYGNSNVVIENLELTGGQDQDAIASHGTDGAAPSSGVIVYGNTIHDRANGVHTGFADSDWTVERNRISDMSDNGIFFDRRNRPCVNFQTYDGSRGMKALYNTIARVGQNPPYPAHGIYDNSVGGEVVGNAISAFGNGKPAGDGSLGSSGVSIRFRDSVVADNVLDGQDVAHTNGIDFFAMDSVAGGSARWERNRISGVSHAGIYVAREFPGSQDCNGQPRPGALAPAQAFRIAENTIATTGNRGAMIDFEYPNGSLTLSGNVGAGATRFEQEPPKPSRPNAVRLVQSDGDLLSGAAWPGARAVLRVADRVLALLR
ncbi:MAG: right-handed parallel beta-helix repeat-containing protein [Solirubrobacterales bacterium]|nr:right-handed parallel beta-helix repeat-containing protein [Solirubrobacterales bacterium]